jgi:hypothetical protein
MSVSLAVEYLRRFGGPNKGFAADFSPKQRTAGSRPGPPKSLDNRNSGFDTARRYAKYAS